MPVETQAVPEKQPSYFSKENLAGYGKFLSGMGALVTGIRGGDPTPYRMAGQNLADFFDTDDNSDSHLAELLKSSNDEIAKLITRLQVPEGTKSIDVSDPRLGR
jgi:hypothetical protein